MSRQVVAEVVKVFYKANTLGINNDTRSCCKVIPLSVRQSTGNGAPGPTDSVEGASRRELYNSKLTRIKTGSFVHIKKEYVTF